jgi:pimeloyl-ACP methyl ester carboxylesterase
MLFFLLLTVGCKREIDKMAAATDVNNEIVNKVTNLKTVTTIGGTATEFGCTIATLKSGEIIEICKPLNWNGKLILYAHGYVSVYKPLALPTEADFYTPLFISLGYGFATTSYSANGLAIQIGIDNILDLRKRFIKEFGEPTQTYLTGASEGGLVTTLAIEQHPELFSGGLPLCGPCGDFQRQINYYGDFRVLFDYFFPGVLPGNVITIPDGLIANWESVYVPAILQAIAQNVPATLKLLYAAQAAFVPGDANTIANTVIGLLWYDVFATRDAIDKFKGQPYDNTNTVYSIPGSPEESLLLNQQVPRFASDKKAQKEIQKYFETSADISIPVVKAHTTGDPIIPFWHLPLYQAKTVDQGTTSFFTGIPVQRYGHCTFTEAEIVNSFGLLVQKVEGQMPLRVQRLVSLSHDTKGKIIQSVHTIRTY